MENIHVQRLADKIKSDLSSSLDSFLNTPLNEEALRNMTECVKRTLRKNAPKLDSKIDFKCVQNSTDPNKVDLVPKNLYTLILLAGLEEPPVFDMPETGRYRTEVADYSLTKIIVDGEETFTFQIY